MSLSEKDSIDPARIARRLKPPQVRALLALTEHLRTTYQGRGAPNQNACGGLEARGLAVLSGGGGGIVRAKLSPLGAAVRESLIAIQSERTGA